MKERFWELLAKFWSGEINNEEKAELEQLLLEHPAYWLKAGMLEQLSFKQEQELPDDTFERIFQKTSGKIAALPSDDQPSSNTTDHIGNKRKVKIWFGAVATIIILIVAGYAWFAPAQKSAAIKWQKITTTPGMKSNIILADGTNIWLNAGSTLRYPETFNNKVREVFLSGEAYFKVKHDSAKPFIIHTMNMDIKDLGTEFDVRDYPGEDFSETSLVEGAVEVAVKDDADAQKIMLKPHQKIVVKNRRIAKADSSKAAKETEKVKDTVYHNIALKTIRPVENISVPEAAWKEDKLVFQDETLENLCKRLERWYGISISITNEKLAQQRFTGRADNVSLNDLLRILQEVKPFHYQIKDQQVIIN